MSRSKAGRGLSSRPVKAAQAASSRAKSRGLPTVHQQAGSEPQEVLLCSVADDRSFQLWRLPPAGAAEAEAALLVRESLPPSGAPVLSAALRPERLVEEPPPTLS